MSFGGAVSAMITSMKNNKRKRPSAYEKIENYGGNYNTKLQFDKKATPEQLKKIRQKLKKENQKAFFIKVTFFVTLLGVIFYLIW